jgi:hypothetical protein
MRWSEEVRLAGARFYEEADRKAAKAGKMVAEYLRDQAPARAGFCCKRWWQKLNQTGSVVDIPPSGRPRKVPEELAKKIAKKILARRGAEAGGPVNLQEVLDKHPRLKKEVERLMVHRQTLVRRIRAAEPALAKRKSG